MAEALSRDVFIRFTLEPELLARVEGARGVIRRNVFMRELALRWARHAAKRDKLHRAAKHTPRGGVATDDWRNAPPGSNLVRYRINADEAAMVDSLRGRTPRNEWLMAAAARELDLIESDELPNFP